MKRLNKAIIFVVVFVLLFSIVVSAAEPYSNPVNLFDSDPVYFELTEDEQNEFPDLIYNGKICIEYTRSKDTTAEKRVRVYCAVYSNYKNFGAYFYQEEMSGGGFLDYLIYRAKIGDKFYIKWGSDLNNNEFVKLIDHDMYSSYEANRGFVYTYTYSGNTTKSNAGTNAYDINIISTDFPIFQNETDYNTYRETGVINNALYNPTPKDYSSELYFKSFDVIPHVSNSTDTYYFDIKYELSDYAKKNVKNLNLNFQNEYEIYLSFANGSISNGFAKTNWYSNSISLAEHPYGFSIMLKDLGCYQYAVSSLGFYLPDEAILGYQGFLIETLNDVLQKIMGNVTAATVDGSYLYLKFNLRFSNNGNVVIGKRNDFTYDFLTKETKKYLYVPDTVTDSSGNTTFVKDTDGNISYTQEGDTKTSKDYYSQEGDKYYYTDNNGSKKEITETDYNNSSANVDIDINIGNGSGEYINVNPVDFNQFVKGMEEMLKQFDTKGGLFLLIKDVFSMYPPEVTTIAVGAIAAIAIVSIICILRR